MTLHYWFMLPISILIATIAMASGVGGATFFSPLFILGLRLSPEVAIGTALITEVFGFASGVWAYAHKKWIDYRLAALLLMVTIPAAFLGTWLAGWVPAEFLKTVLGLGLVAVALSFLRSPEQADVRRMDAAILEDFPTPQRILVTAQGEEIAYTVCNQAEGRTIAGVGGLFVGMISTGLGELNSYFLLQRCRVPSRVSVATSVLVVAVTALVASIGHFVNFFRSGGDVLPTVLSIVIFTVPGVVLGGQLGSLVASRIPQKMMERILGALFLVVAALTLGEVLLGH